MPADVPARRVQASTRMPAQHAWRTIHAAAEPPVMICRQDYNTALSYCDCGSSGYTGIACNVPPASAPNAGQAASAPATPTTGLGCTWGCVNGFCRQAINSAAKYCDCIAGYTGVACNMTANVAAPAPGPSTAAGPGTPPTLQGCAAAGGCVHGVCRQAFNSAASYCLCSPGFTGATCNLTSTPR